jgi:hypothetical protein
VRPIRRFSDMPSAARSLFREPAGSRPPSTGEPHAISLTRVDEPRDLRTSFELLGEFWLPESPERQVGGVARYSSERLTLSLTGSLRDSGALAPETFILGATDGGLVTLQSLLPTGSNITNSGGWVFTRSQYVAQRLFIGAHFSSDADVRFQHVAFGFEALDPWRAQIPFEIKSDKDEGGESITTATHRLPADTERFQLPNDDASIEWDITFSRNLSAWSELKWKLRNGIRVEPKTPQPMEWFDGYQQDLRSLLSLLVGEPVAPTWTVGKLTDSPLANVGVYSRFTGKHGTRELHPAEMLMSRQEVGARWQAIVGAWFENRDTLRSTTNLFFGTLYDDEWFLEFQFIALTQALETFHRQLFGGDYVDDTTYEEIRLALTGAIPSSTPTDLRAALKSRIKYGNQFSQRRRFKELLESLSPECHAIVVDGEDFVGRIVEERNFLTHYDDSDGFQPMSHHKLHEMVVRLRALLTLLLLAQIGIVGGEAETALRRTRWYRGYIVE